ncbi:hypothetical protein WA026_020946 [Henosepilachna vigintioctopunctata]|uniref:Uncharacterized protein n=1 Tax=Henosepilachna vigintioctopunctata TaxID=420089 RepID=A0AAW1VGS9_9CUCU
MGSPKINKALVQQIFESMAYNSEKMETKVEMDDLVKHQSTDEINSLIARFINCDKFYTIENLHRQKLINKLASEIEKEEESFVKLLMNVSPFHIKKIFLPFFAGTLRYYSNYCQLVQDNCNYILVCKICEIGNLSLLSYVFGPSLAAGYRILFIVSHQMYKILKFIEIIMRGIGFPEGSISVMVDDFDLNLVLLHANTISFFDVCNQPVPNIKTMCIHPFLLQL